MVAAGPPLRPFAPSEPSNSSCFGGHRKGTQALANCAGRGRPLWVHWGGRRKESSGGHWVMKREIWGGTEQGEVRKGSDQPRAPGTQGEPTTITRLCHPPSPTLPSPPLQGSRPISDLSSLGPLAACEANLTQFLFSCGAYTSCSFLSLATVSKLLRPPLPYPYC